MRATRTRAKKGSGLAKHTYPVTAHHGAAAPLLLRLLCPRAEQKTLSGRSLEGPNVGRATCRLCRQPSSSADQRNSKSRGRRRTRVTGCGLSTDRPSATFLGFHSAPQARGSKGRSPLVSLSPSFFAPSGPGFQGPEPLDLPFPKFLPFRGQPPQARGSKGLRPLVSLKEKWVTWSGQRRC